MSCGDKNRPNCPIGESQCDHVDELMTLRGELEALSAQVLTDPLTRLYNYRHFTQALELELERTQRTGHPSALIMLDLDYFKRINDVWGHEVGNQVLRHTAERLLSLLRKIDIACRYGGEEFALILPGTPLHQAVNAAKRLRAALEASPIMVDDQPLSITASLGVGVYRRGSGLSAEAFIKQVDNLLYQAKSEGRNRVVHQDLEDHRPKGQVGVEEKAALYCMD